MSFLNTLIPSISRAEGDTVATRRPRYEVSETEAAYSVTVSLPGVAKESLEITDENGELRISGKRATALPEGRVALHRETSDAAYELVLAHDGTVDTGKIGAELKDGVLSLTLAKAESAKPRKIAVA
jgi:HSP20 family molecular chaperone IbpA